MADPAAGAKQIDGEDFVIAERPGRTCIDLRGDGRDTRFTRAVASVTDLAPPIVPGSAANGLLASVLWLGPDEWLVVSETQTASELASQLRQALAGIRSALTDVGDGYIVYALHGPSVREVLAKGCSLDLDPRAFPAGRCARTLLAKLSVLVHLRAPDPAFELYVARSYREYAWAWLAAAATEFLPLR